MIFEKWLIPDLFLGKYSDVTPELVKEMGGKALICDIDNTLATYGDATPPEALLKWIKHMRESGVEIAFVSNNSKRRVNGFNKDLGLVAYAMANKPSYRFLKKAVEDLGLKREDAVFMGDQLLTDCAAAKRFGIPAIMVPPIKDKTSLFFRAKRWLERPYVEKYKEKREGKCQKD